LKLNIGCGSDTWGDIRIDIDPKASAVNLIADAHYLPLDFLHAELNAYSRL